MSGFSVLMVNLSHWKEHYPYDRYTYAHCFWSYIASFEDVELAAFHRSRRQVSGPDVDGDTAMSPSSVSGDPYALHALSRTEITYRTITLMNIPDTVNLARVRTLAEVQGDITKLTLRPDYQGAII